jgi:hypothetical protein
MTKKLTSARARGAPKTRPPPTIHVYDRRRIMSRAWTLAREARLDAAQKAFDASMTVVAGRITHEKPLSAFIAAIPLNLSAAQKRAWAEAKGVVSANETHSPRSTALVILRQAGALAPLRRMRFARVFRLMSTVAHWIGSKFIPSRAA